MNQKKKTVDKIFWGLLFIAGAIVLILSRLGSLSGISLFTILFTILFIWMLLKGIAHVNFAEILFSLAFLACIYDDMLGITALTPWTVLGAALLGSIGLNILFPRKHNWHVHHQNGTAEKIIIDVPDNETLHLENSFGSSTKHIESEHFCNAHLETSFGELKVYYDNAIVAQQTVYTKIDAAFGKLTIYVPKTWQVQNNISCAFGSAVIKNPDVCEHPSHAPVLILTGQVAFGSAEIIYI